MRRIVRDQLAIYVLAVVLAVLSVSTIFNVRKLTAAVETQDLIADCLTPGTRCYKISQEQAEVRRKQASAENKCGGR